MKESYYTYLRGGACYELTPEEVKKVQPKDIIWSYEEDGIVYFEVDSIVVED